MKRLILHLGGDIRRGNEALKLLDQHPGASVLVSSEGNDPIKWYQDHGATVKHDTEAWDTVTNFTYTFERIKRDYSPDEIIVVTHDWHMPRAIAIANAVYLFRGIKITPGPYTDGSTRDSDRDHLAVDRLRALLWRFTGVLLFHGSTYDQRCPSRPVRANEVRLRDWMWWLYRWFV